MAGEGIEVPTTLAPAVGQPGAGVAVVATPVPAAARTGAGTTGATVVQPSPTTPTSAHLVFVVVVCVYLTRWSAAALCEEVFTAC